MKIPSLLQYTVDYWLLSRSRIINDESNDRVLQKTIRSEPLNADELTWEGCDSWLVRRGRLQWICFQKCPWCSCFSFSVMWSTVSPSSSSNWQPFFPIYLRNISVDWFVDRLLCLSQTTKTTTRRSQSTVRWLWNWLAIIMIVKRNWRRWHTISKWMRERGERKEDDVLFGDWLWCWRRNALYQDCCPSFSYTKY